MNMESNTVMRAREWRTKTKIVQQAPIHILAGVVPNNTFNNFK